jgi:ABC-2 type transport system permease protein
MSTPLLLLLRNEVAKARRRKLPYFGLFAIALLSLLIYATADQLIGGTTANGWGYVTLSMQLLFNDLGLIFIIVFSTMLVSEETGTGTIRAALAAPVQRWELYLAKAATGLLYMLLLSGAALLFSAALGGIHYHFGAVGDAFGVVYGRGRISGDFLLGWTLSWIPLAALVMYGLFISTVVRSTGAAVAVGIGTLYLLEFSKHLVGLDPYIFTRYIELPWIILQQASQGVDYQWQPEVWKMLGLSGAYAAAFFGVGLAIFVRQDLN